MLSFYIPRGIQVKRTNVFDKALKSFNQKARLPTFRLCNRAFLTVFAQEIEDLQSKKGIVRDRRHFMIHGATPPEDNVPVSTRQTLRDLNLRHGIDPDADERLKHAGLHPSIAPMTLGSLLESSASFPVSAARREMFEGHRKPFNCSEECPTYPTPELLVVAKELKPAVLDEVIHREVAVRQPFTFADLVCRRLSGITGIEALGWMSEDSEVRQVIYDDLKAIGASVGWIWNIEFLYKLPEVEGNGYFVKVMSPFKLCKMSEEIATVGDERFKRDMVHDKQIAFASILAQTLDGNVYSAKKIHELAEEVRKKALMENPKAEVHLVKPFVVAVILKDIIGGKYDVGDAYHNKVTFDIYQSHLAMKHGTPIAFQIPLPYVGLFTLFKEEMLNELSIYPGLNKATIKDISDQDPATHNKHVRHLMSDAVEKVVQIEKRVTVVDAELYEYITPATSL